MVKKQTKEELILEVFKLKDLIDTVNEREDLMRIEFAKAFSWTKQSRFGSSDSLEYRKPTLTEIFIEIGKLLSKQENYDLRAELRENRDRLFYFESELKKMSKVINQDEKHQ